MEADAYETYDEYRKKKQSTGSNSDLFLINDE